MTRPPTDPELIRRAVARRADGLSYRAIAAEAGKSESTIRKWVAAAGVAKGPPPRLTSEPMPVPVDAETSLPARLDALAAALEGESRHEYAGVARQAATLIRESATDTDAPDPSEDTRGWIVHQIRRTEAMRDRAERAHDPAAARQYASTLERWAARLKQHDSVTSHVDTISITRSELDRRMARMRTAVRALTSQPLRCADCGVRVRMSWVADT